MISIFSSLRSEKILRNFSREAREIPRGARKKVGVSITLFWGGRAFERSEKPAIDKMKFLWYNYYRKIEEVEGMERYDTNQRLGILTVLKKWVDRGVESQENWFGKRPKIYVLGALGDEFDVEGYVVYNNKCDESWTRTVLCLLDEDDVAYCDTKKNGDYIGYVQNVYGYGGYWKWGWGVVEDANI